MKTFAPHLVFPSSSSLVGSTLAVLMGTSPQPKARPEHFLEAKSEVWVSQKQGLEPQDSLKQDLDPL